MKTSEYRVFEIMVLHKFKAPWLLLLLGALNILDSSTFYPYGVINDAVSLV
jgi:hypothetical protein